MSSLICPQGHALPVRGLQAAPWTSSGRSSRGLRDLQILGAVPSQLGSERSGEEAGLVRGCGVVWGRRGRRSAVLCHLSPQRHSPTSLCLLFMNLPSVLGLRVSRLVTVKNAFMCRREWGEDSIPFLGHLPAWEYQGLSVVPHAQPQGLYNLTVHRGRTNLGDLLPSSCSGEKP